LAIGLGVLCGGHAMLYAPDFHGPAPKFRAKTNITIRNKSKRHPMVPNDSTFKEFSKAFTGYGFVSSFDVYHLRQSIHKNNNGVIAPCRDWQISDKVK
jgi:hypothetical protein